VPVKKRAKLATVKRWRIWLLDDSTGTKRPVAKRGQRLFNRRERDGIVSQLTRQGHAVEVEPVQP